jgi:hypothetical protein
MTEIEQECLCGQPMRKLMEDGTFVLWSCTGTDCSRLLLQGSGFEVAGTWYTPEQNEVKEKF